MRVIRQIVLPTVGIVTLLALMACANEPVGPIPDTANMVVEGNASLTYTPTLNGRIWVYNQTSQNLVYSGRVRTGELVEVDMQGNEIRVAGRAVVTKQLQLGQQYRIYFEAHATESSGY